MLMAVNHANHRGTTDAIHNAQHTDCVAMETQPVAPETTSLLDSLPGDTNRAEKSWSGGNGDDDDVTAENHVTRSPVSDVTDRRRQDATTQPVNLRRSCRV